MIASTSVTPMRPASTVAPAAPSGAMPETGTVNTAATRPRSAWVIDVGFVRFIVEHYHARGLRIAIGDCGAGHSGLNLLAELQPDLVKLDRGLCHRVDRERARRAIVRGMVQVCRELEIQPIAEGVETRDEVRCLQDLGIELFQGCCFARPAFEAQAELAFDA
jgi:EAL domain-containing protein (putative c-di-GMP-specific phosphodiesterase class I)